LLTKPEGSELAICTPEEVIFAELARWCPKAAGITPHQLMCPKAPDSQSALPEE